MKNYLSIDHMNRFVGLFMEGIFLFLVFWFMFPVSGYFEEIRHLCAPTLNQTVC